MASQRGRMLDAMAAAVAEKGYPATTVADVITRAGVSRKTFYEQFRDKEDCFLAAYDPGVALLLGALREAGSDETALLERARRRTRAYLETLASEPAFARTFMIEVDAAGPAARERRAAVHDRFAALLREQVEAARAPPQPPQNYPAPGGAAAPLVSPGGARRRGAGAPP